MITYLFLGFFSVFSILILWFLSPLKITLGRIIFKKDYKTVSDFDDKLFTVNPILGKLSGCWICVSFWTSLAVGIVFMYGFSLPIYFPVLTFFIYPGICYFLFTKLKF